MARSSRNTNLETRTKRLKLEKAKRHWQTVGKGLALGYRLGENSGTWYARKALDDNKYAVRSIGIADDFQDADGINVLDYFQAQNKVREQSQQVNIKSAQHTVNQAINDYLANYKIENKPKEKTLKSAVAVIDKHITQELGHHAVNELTYNQLKKWRNKLAKPDLSKLTDDQINDEELIYDITRKKQASANRILNYLKAILNYAYNHIDTIAIDSAWRRLKPFRHVDADNVRPLTTAEAKRLINACPTDFRLLVRGALYTGCRYGELASLKVKDFDPDNKQITITKRVAKSSKQRLIPLNNDGYKYFQQLTVGKNNNDHVFLRTVKHEEKDPVSKQVINIAYSYEPWEKSQQKRRMDDASKIARIDPPVTFHNLRDTYASLLVSNGVPLKAVADLLGHSDTRVTERCYAKFQQSAKEKLVKKHLPSFGIESTNVEGISNAR